jgi:hypothetical protein
MDWLYFILVEIALLTVCGLLGTYFVWLWNRRKFEYGYLLNKYGYMIGGIGALIISMIWIILF